jgi:hypothetical protein
LSFSRTLEVAREAFNGRDLLTIAVPIRIATCASALGSDLDTVPAYLLAHYWWAYIHPWGDWPCSTDGVLFIPLLQSLSRR